MINGKVKSSAEYTFFMRPKRTGTFEIGPAECRIQGQSLRSNTETLTVIREAPTQTGEGRPLFLTASLSQPEARVE